MKPLFDTLSPDQAIEIARKYSTPVYVYSESLLQHQAQAVLSFPNPFGLTVRYAMKALPTRGILRLFHRRGLHIDASSYYEVLRAQYAGIPSKHILLTAQELPSIGELQPFLRHGGLVTASSLNQLEYLASTFPGIALSLRFNPGVGSGQYQQVNVGGSSSSFGIWHEDILVVSDILREYGCIASLIHTHIGSGTEPGIWKQAAELSLRIVDKFPSAHTLNLGGGFAVARMPDEKEADLQQSGKEIKEALLDFQQRSGRKLTLEIEPGAYLVAQAGVLLSQVIDVKATDTGNFIVVNSGMTEVARPALYGAQHPLAVISRRKKTLLPAPSAERSTKSYVVAGHCCESGDVWTLAPGNQNAVLPRELPLPEIGDMVMLGGAGAYCSGMNLAGYNSFPAAAEVLLGTEGTLRLLRRRQSLDRLIQDEV